VSNIIDKIKGKEGVVLFEHNQEVPEASHQEGLVFELDSAYVGKDINLKKSKLSNTWSFQCATCGHADTISQDDIQAGIPDFGKVSIYQKIAQDAKDIKDAKDFIDYLLRYKRVQRKSAAEFSSGGLKSSSALIKFKCSNCGRENAFNAIVTATLEHNIDLSSVEGITHYPSMNVEAEFELYDSDKPQTLSHLIEAKKYLGLLEKLPLSFNGHSKLLWRINWDDHDKPALEQAENFIQKIQLLRADIAKASTITDEMINSLESANTKFGTLIAQESVSSIISNLKLNFCSGTEKKLRRLLAENILWLADEIEKRLIGGEEYRE